MNDMKNNDMNNIVDIAPIKQFMDRIGVERVFGAPTKEGDVTIIPVADVTFGFGYGGGYGSEGGEKSNEGGEATGTDGAVGGGSGVGAGGHTKARGYVQIGPDGVKYEPIVNPLWIPLAGIFMGAWAVFWGTATIRTVAKAVARTKQARA